MKVLMIYCKKFAYAPQIKTLDDFPEVIESSTFNNVLVAFIHAEEHDEINPKSVETKLLKNLKWASKKNDCKNILLHSFAHLAETKAEPHFTKGIFDIVENRLKNTDYECHQTPFGYFLDLNLDAPGVSQARIYKAF